MASLIETFTSADGTEIDSRNSDSGHSWTETNIFGAANNAGKITSNKLRCAVAAGGLYYSSWVPLGPNYSVFGDLTWNGSTASSSSAQLVGRKPASNVFDCYRVYLFSQAGADPFFWLQCVSGGAQSNFASATTGTLTSGQISYSPGPAAVGTTYAVELRMIGSTISVYINGVLRMSGPSAVVTAAGRAALAVAGVTGSTAPTIDNVSGVDYVPAGTAAISGGGQVTAVGQKNVSGAAAISGGGQVSAVGGIPVSWANGWTYRQSAPVANPKTAGDRVLTIPFAAWFLKDQGKILGSSYEDVHVTDAAGIDLPCVLNAAKNSLTIDYASMPQGITTLYVFYGKAGATPPPSPSIISPSTITRYQAIGFNGEMTGAGSAVTDYIWGTDLDATYLDSGATGTYYGASTSHLAGVTSAGRKYHLLIKPGEWMLRKGVTSIAKLHLYADGVAGVAEDLTLRAHRFRSTGQDSPNATTRHERWVWPSWTQQDWSTFNAPTWDSRYYSYTQAAYIPWQTAGAVHANEIDSAEYVAATVLTAGAAAGYKTLNLAPGWVDDWQGDDYSQGILVKDSTDSAGAANRYLSISAPSQTNSPVVEVTYSALGNQLAARKLTSDTYQASTFAVQNRYCLIPGDDSFAIIGNINAEQAWDLFYIAPTGEIRRMIHNGRYPTKRGSLNSPGWGMHYDESTGRIWLGGSYDDTAAGEQKAYLAYTSPYVLDGLTYTASGDASVNKATIIARNDIVTVVYPFLHVSDRDQDAIKTRTYTRSTDTWSSATTLYTGAPTGTRRTLATGINSGDVMAGAGEIALSGVPSSYYPAFGSVVIDSEVFWYTGRDDVLNKLTGVSRTVGNTTAGTHASGAQVYVDGCEPTYFATSYDPTLDRLRVTCSLVSLAGTGYTLSPSPGSFTYTKTFSFEYDYAQTRWEDSAGNALSLPLNQMTMPVISRANAPAYAMNMLALPDTGHALLSFGEHRAPLTTYPTGGVTWSDTRVDRWDGASWSSVDVADMLEVSLIGMGSFVRATGVSTAHVSKVVRAASTDEGVTWGAQNTVATLALAAPVDQTNWTTALWCSNCTEKGYTGNVGIAYWQHFAQHGAIYINEITPAGGGEMVGTATVTGGGAVTGAGIKRAVGAASVSGGGASTATGAKRALGTAQTTGGGRATSQGSKAASGITTVTGGGLLVTVGTKGASGVAGVSGGGAVTATGSGVVSPVPAGAASITGGGQVVSSGQKNAIGTASISGGGAVTATGADTSSAVRTVTRYTATTRPLGQHGAGTRPVGQHGAGTRAVGQHRSGVNP